MRFNSKFPARSTLIYVLLFLVGASTASASVNVGITLYNSDSTVSEDVNVENANYASTAVLLPYTGFADFPYSIHSSGAGSSTSSEGKFSDSISANKNGEGADEVYASVKTNSGSFQWGKSIDSSNDISMAIGVATKITNGDLDSSYSNSNSAVEKEVSTWKGKYADKSYITAGSISSFGSGSSLDEIENGFLSHIEAQHLGRTAMIDSGILENSEIEGADNKFSDKLKLNSKSASLEGSLSILSNNKCELLPMIGISSGPIIAGMKFTPFYTNTERSVFEVQTVPKDSYPISFRTVERTMPSNIKTFEDITLSMIAKWS